MTLEVGQLDKRAGTQMRQKQLGEGVEEMRVEIVTLRQELLRLGKMLNPLSAITDLCLARKRVNDSTQFSQGEVRLSIEQMTETEK